MTQNLNDKIIKSSKWSFVTELVAKLITPISSILLARLLAPEAFGALALLMMVISFADMLADAGFSKYIVQREFNSYIDKSEQVAVAYWSNFFLAIAMCLLVMLMSDRLAMLINAKGLERALAVISVAIPINALSSIHLAVLRREFRFDTLFKIRLISIITPLIVTLPMAYGGFGYWALICGYIANSLVTGLMATYFSVVKIMFNYQVKVLFQMLGFSIWSLIEAIAIWLTAWGEMFIIGDLLNTYYLGLYRNSMMLVNSLLGLFVAATVPVLYAGLSRLQNDDDKYKSFFYYFQRLIGMAVIPMGVGIYCYRELIVKILFGPEWLEASLFIGLWGLTSALMIVWGHYCSEVYRSRGLPKLSFWAQILHLIFLMPTVYYFAQHSFEELAYARNVVRMQFVAVHITFMYLFFKFSPTKMIINVLPFIAISLCMGILATVIQHIYDGIWWQLLTVGICILFYMSVLFTVKDYREFILGFIRNKGNSFI